MIWLILKLGTCTQYFDTEFQYWASFLVLVQIKLPIFQNTELDSHLNRLGFLMKLVQVPDWLIRNFCSPQAQCNDWQVILLISRLSILIYPGVGKIQVMKVTDYCDCQELNGMRTSVPYLAGVKSHLANPQFLQCLSFCSYMESHLVESFRKSQKCR